MIPKRREQVGALTLHVYGVDKALRPYHEGMEQGYYVEKDGQPTARAELTAEERQAIKHHLTVHHPEHARL